MVRQVVQLAGSSPVSKGGMGRQPPAVGSFYEDISEPSSLVDYIVEPIQNSTPVVDDNSTGRVVFFADETAYCVPAIPATLEPSTYEVGASSGSGREKVLCHHSKSRLRRHVARRLCNLFYPAGTSETLNRSNADHGAPSKPDWNQRGVEPGPSAPSVQQLPGLDSSIRGSASSHHPAPHVTF